MKGIQFNISLFDSLQPKADVKNPDQNRNNDRKSSIPSEDEKEENEGETNPEVSIVACQKGKNNKLIKEHVCLFVICLYVKKQKGWSMILNLIETNEVCHEHDRNPCYLATKKDENFRMTNKRLGKYVSLHHESSAINN